MHHNGDDPSISSSNALRSLRIRLPIWASVSSWNVRSFSSQPVRTTGRGCSTATTSPPTATTATAQHHGHAPSSARAVRASKLAMTWTEPHEVLRTVNPFVFETRPCVVDQGKRKPQLVHVVRMRRFANAPLRTAADTVAIEKAAIHDFPDNIPQKLLAHKREAGGMHLRVR